MILRGKGLFGHVRLFRFFRINMMAKLKYRKDEWHPVQEIL